MTHPGDRTVSQIRHEVLTDDEHMDQQPTGAVLPWIVRFALVLIFLGVVLWLCTGCGAAETIDEADQNLVKMEQENEKLRATVKRLVNHINRMTMHIFQLEENNARIREIARQQLYEGK